MEDNIQTILVIIVSAFLLFIFPVYMAYEKKDDISYALAVRYTQDLVNEVRSKGYISKYMYEDYRARLKITGNSYDIEMTHKYNRYDPITNYYAKEGTAYVLKKTSTQEARQQELLEAKKAGKLAANPTVEEIETYDANNGYAKVEDTYMLSYETYGTEQILKVLETEKKLNVNANGGSVTCEDDTDDCQYAYTMNVDDNFSVSIKNTNTTLATVIYNMVTVNTADVNTRIYVNYGGSIISTKWFGKTDLSKQDREKITVAVAKDVQEFKEERHFADIKPVERINKTYAANYALEFSVLPEAITELKDMGKINLDNYSKYNFAFGSTEYRQNRLSISVGMNGISVLNSKDGEVYVLLTYAMDIKEYTKIKLEFVNGEILLYIDGMKVAESLKISDQNAVIQNIGETKVNRETEYFEGYLKNIKLYELIQ